MVDNEERRLRRERHEAYRAREALGEPTSGLTPGVPIVPEALDQASLDRWAEADARCAAADRALRDFERVRR